MLQNFRRKSGGCFSRFLKNHQEMQLVKSSCIKTNCQLFLMKNVSLSDQELNQNQSVVGMNIINKCLIINK